MFRALSGFNYTQKSLAKPRIFYEIIAASKLQLDRHMKTNNYSFSAETAASDDDDRPWTDDTTPIGR